MEIKGGGAVLIKYTPRLPEFNEHEVNGKCLVNKSEIIKWHEEKLIPIFESGVEVYSVKMQSDAIVWEPEKDRTSTHRALIINIEAIANLDSKKE